MRALCSCALSAGSVAALGALETVSIVTPSLPCLLLSTVLVDLRRTPVRVLKVKKITFDIDFNAR